MNSMIARPATGTFEGKWAALVICNGLSKTHVLFWQQPFLLAEGTRCFMPLSVRTSSTLLLLSRISIRIIDWMRNQQQRQSWTIGPVERTTHYMPNNLLSSSPEVMQLVTKISETLNTELSDESLCAIMDLLQAGTTSEQIVAIVTAVQSHTWVARLFLLILCLKIISSLAYLSTADCSF